MKSSVDWSHTNELKSINCEYIRRVRLSKSYFTTVFIDMILRVRSGGGDIQRLYSDLCQLRDLDLWINSTVHQRGRYSFS